jgi:hypothetical protein
VEVIEEEEGYALVMIDYFMRMMRIKVLRGKNMTIVAEAVDRVRRGDMAMDSRRELCGEIFEEVCRRRGIKPQK